MADDVIRNTKPMNDPDDSELDTSAEGQGMPSVAGVFSHYEQARFNVAKELANMVGESPSYLVKANLKPRRIIILRRMVMEEMIDRDGVLDAEGLMHLEALLSVAESGYRAEQLVELSRPHPGQFVDGQGGGGWRGRLRQFARRG